MGIHPHFKNEKTKKEISSIVASGSMFLNQAFDLHGIPEAASRHAGRGKKVIEKRQQTAKNLDFLSGAA